MVSRWLKDRGYEYKLQIRYHDDGINNEEEIIKEWCKKLEITPPRCFVGKLQANKGKNNRRLAYGCGQIRVDRVKLYFLVMGGISFLKSC